MTSKLIRYPSDSFAPASAAARPQGDGLTRLTLRIVASAALVSLAGCSSFNSASSRVASVITPYKIEVVQGNFVSKEQFEAIRPGMPRAQVRDILGSPLVTSVFHADRWDYVFTIRRQGTEPQQRQLTVFFKGDEVQRVEGGELPTEADFVATLGTSRSLGKVPLLEVPADVLKEFGLKAEEQKQALARTNPASNAPNSVATTFPPLEAPGTTASAWDASAQRIASTSPVARASAAPAAAVAAAPLLSAAAPSPAPTRAATAAPAPAAATPAPATAASPAPAAVVTPTAPSAAPAPAVALAPAPAPAAALAPAPAPAPARAPAPAAAAAAPATPVATPSTATPPVIAAAPVVSAQAAPAPAPAAPVLAPAPSPASAAPATAVRSGGEAIDPDINSFLARWQSDWQSRNATAYFAHYVPEFKGTSSTRAEWEALRRPRIESRLSLSIAVLDVRARMVSPTEARVVFRQVYESDAGSEVGTKAMFLVKQGGRWMIEREFFTPAQ